MVQGWISYGSEISRSFYLVYKRGHKWVLGMDRLKDDLRMAEEYI